MMASIILHREPSVYTYTYCTSAEQVVVSCQKVGVVVVLGILCVDGGNEWLTSHKLVIKPSVLCIVIGCGINKSVTRRYKTQVWQMHHL